jgi:two-component system, OmpR family, aerobic respiration control sensor histidine kinase ArcB
MAEENSLREKENAEFALAYVIEHLPGHVYWKNKDSVFQGCNFAQAKSAGFSEISEMIGKTDYEMPWSNEADILRQLDLMVMSTKQELTREETSKVANSDEVATFLSRKVPFLNKKGEVIGVLGISLDITERKKMEEDLRRAKSAAESANYIMTEFISNMGHDLSTPLSDIGSVAEMFKYYLDEYPELKDLIETLINRYADCEKVRNRIIAATSIANLEVKYETFSITQVLLDLKKELQPTIGTKKLKIIIRPFKPKKEDIIETDRKKCKAILFDFLSNGINFTEAGQVTISVIKEGNLFYIKVSDTGIGIPSDKFDYIFQQYTKLSRSNKYGPTFKGVGAGLYLARLRANILNATISVESEVGKGSTFTLSIPAHPVKNQ